nr:MAG TPA: hypothetical protein [Caudoviricetes sp.]
MAEFMKQVLNQRWSTSFTARGPISGEPCVKSENCSIVPSH